MKIQSFKNINFIKLYKNNDEARELGYSIFQNVIITGRNNNYPNILLLIIDDKQENRILISPYDEKIMSLNKDSFYDNNSFEVEELSTISYSLKCQPILDTVFFLIYNFDNYFHFLYDTLPYLYTYLQLKKHNSNLKLLINYPNPYKTEFYKFNTELLEKIVDKKYWLIHNDENVYNKIYVSTSLTHGGLSNNPPCKEIYEIYDKIISNNRFSCNSICATRELQENEYIYISRRTWINNDNSNIGTDYTTRRKMINEDKLVEELSKNGIKEIFAENLSTDEKIQLFNNAKVVIGSIGGGMSNLLFSKPTTKSLIIVTPYFLDINYRFKYCMENTNITYFNNTKTYYGEKSIPLYCRVKIKIGEKYKNNIGEIIECKIEDNKEKYLINISRNDVAGFNNDVNFEKDWFCVEDFELLDNGLNSPYEVNIEKLMDTVIQMCK